jgi:glycine cleavage system transcriptional repressor
MSQVVLTLTGPDRVGIVEEVTGALLGLGGNVETSRMTRLGGEFAILLLVAVPEEVCDRIEASLRSLTSEGYALAVRRTAPAREITGRHYSVQVDGADHEGIIHEIAAGLSRDGINIESMDTETVNAPESGTLVFSMTAVVSVPVELAEESWQRDLQAAANQAGVDVGVEAL